MTQLSSPIAIQKVIKHQSFRLTSNLLKTLDTQSVKPTMKAAQHVSRDDEEEFGLTRDSAKEKSHIDQGEILGLTLPNLASGQGSQLGLGELGECAHRLHDSPLVKMKYLTLNFKVIMHGSAYF